MTGMNKLKVFVEVMMLLEIKLEALCVANVVHFTDKSAPYLKFCCLV